MRHDSRVPDCHSFSQFERLQRHRCALCNNNVSSCITCGDKDCGSALGVKVANDRDIEARRANYLANEGGSELTCSDETGTNGFVCVFRKDRVAVYRGTCALINITLAGSPLAKNVNRSHCSNVA